VWQWGGFFSFRRGPLLPGPEAFPRGALCNHSDRSPLASLTSRPLLWAPLIARTVTGGHAHSSPNDLAPLRRGFFAGGQQPEAVARGTDLWAVRRCDRRRRLELLIRGPPCQPQNQTYPIGDSTGQRRIKPVPAPETPSGMALRCHSGQGHGVDGALWRGLPTPPLVITAFGLLMS
jgi:hypothetical protein